MLWPPVVLIYHMKKDTAILLCPVINSSFLPEIKKVEMYGIEIPISTYRTQGAITFKVLSLKHTEISTGRYFLCYKKPEL